MCRLGQAPHFILCFMVGVLRCFIFSEIGALGKWAGALVSGKGRDWPARRLVERFGRLLREGALRLQALRIWSTSKVIRQMPSMVGNRCAATAHGSNCADGSFNGSVAGSGNASGGNNQQSQ